MNDALMQMLTAAAAGGGQDQKEQRDPQNTHEALSDALRRIAVTSNIKVGDIIAWKPGLKNKRIPCYNEPVVVIEVLDPPVFDNDKDAGSAYFRDSLDIRVGFFRKNDFVTFHHTSSRFQQHVRPFPIDDDTDATA